MTTATKTKPAELGNTLVGDEKLTGRKYQNRKKVLRLRKQLRELKKQGLTHTEACQYLKKCGKHRYGNNLMLMAYQMNDTLAAAHEKADKKAAGAMRNATAERRMVPGGNTRAHQLVYRENRKGKNLKLSGAAEHDWWRVCAKVWALGMDPDGLVQHGILKALEQYNSGKLKYGRTLDDAACSCAVNRYNNASRMAAANSRKLSMVHRNPLRCGYAQRYRPDAQLEAKDDRRMWLERRLYLVEDADTRQRQVLALALQGYTQRATAELLGTSQPTVSRTLLKLEQMGQLVAR